MSVGTGSDSMEQYSHLRNQKLMEQLENLQEFVKKSSVRTEKLRLQREQAISELKNQPWHNQEPSQLPSTHGIHSANGTNEPWSRRFTSGPLSSTHRFDKSDSLKFSEAIDKLISDCESCHLPKIASRMKRETLRMSNDSIISHSTRSSATSQDYFLPDKSSPNRGTVRHENTEPHHLFSDVVQPNALLDQWNSKVELLSKTHSRARTCNEEGLNQTDKFGAGCLTSNGLDKNYSALDHLIGSKVQNPEQSNAVTTTTTAPPSDALQQKFSQYGFRNLTDQIKSEEKAKGAALHVGLLESAKKLVPDIPAANYNSNKTVTSNSTKTQVHLLTDPVKNDGKVSVENGNILNQQSTLSDKSGLQLTHNLPMAGFDTQQEHCGPENSISESTEVSDISGLVASNKQQHQQPCPIKSDTLKAPEFTIQVGDENNSDMNEIPSSVNAIHEVPPLPLEAIKEIRHFDSNNVEHEQLLGYGESPHQDGPPIPSSLPESVVLVPDDDVIQDKSMKKQEQPKEGILHFLSFDEHDDDDDEDDDSFFDIPQPTNTKGFQDKTIEDVKMTNERVTDISSDTSDEDCDLEHQLANIINHSPPTVIKHVELQYATNQEEAATSVRVKESTQDLSVTESQRNSTDIQSSKAKNNLTQKLAQKLAVHLGLDTPLSAISAMSPANYEEDEEEDFDFYD